jgi:hypothetical protein
MSIIKTDAAARVGERKRWHVATCPERCSLPRLRRFQELPRHSPNLLRSNCLGRIEDPNVPGSTWLELPLFRACSRQAESDVEQSMETDAESLPVPPTNSTHESMQGPHPNPLPRGEGTKFPLTTNGECIKIRGFDKPFSSRANGIQELTHG